MDNQNNVINETQNVEPTVVPTAEPNVAPTIDPNVAPQTQQFAPNTPVEPTQPKSKKGIIIACVAVLVLVAAGIGIYFGFFRKVTGKEVVNGTINKIFESAIKAADKVENNLVIDYKKDIVKTNGTFKATLTTNDNEFNQQLGNLNSAAIDYDLRLDLKTLSGSLDLTEKENEKAIITVSSLLKDKNLYVKTDKTTDMLKFDLTDELDWDAIDISKLPEFKSKSFSAVLKKLQGYVKNSIKEEYISQEEGEYTVDGVSIKGLKTTITLNEARYNEMTKSIINSIINDDEGLTLLAEYLMTDKNEVKASLEQSKESLDNSNKNSTTIKENDKKSQDLKINIYTTKRGKFLAFDMLDDDKKNGISAVSQNDITTIRVLNDGEETLKLEYNEKEKELTWKNEAPDNKNEKVTIKFYEEGIKVTFSMDGVTATLEFNEKISSEEVSMDLKASLDYEEDGKKLSTSIEFNNSLRKADSLNTFDTSKAKTTDEFSESEQERFTNELTTALESSVLFKLVQGVSKKNEVNQTNTIKSNIYTSTICSQAYECKQYTDDYAYCKYIASDGNIQTILCPLR